MRNPYRYFNAIFFREMVYRFTKKEKIVSAELFFGRKMKIALPAATDIYLTGGKSHSSEIRLAKFLILNLKKGGHFLDIGAHYGYFTLLASEAIGNEGKVMSFEPSSVAYRVLNDNTDQQKNITITQSAVSNSSDNLVFYEFPNLHSEYNSTDVSQFEKESWFQHSQPVRVEVKATTIDLITADSRFLPSIIKIDVEGAEFNVIQGGLNYFEHHAPAVVMEYLEPKRKNESHQKAAQLLKSLGFQSHVIESDGRLRPVADIDAYLEAEKLDSDNIVFICNR